MEDYKSPQNINLRQVLNFNFSTLMLFRCTQKQYGQSFMDGKFRFSQPKDWIKNDDEANKGIGDKLEGIFLVANKNDNSSYITQLKNNESIEHFEEGDLLYFRRKETNELYSTCFYSLNDNSFNKEYKYDDGTKHYISRVTNEYFKGFSNNSSKETYDSMEENIKPVVLFINNPKELFKRIKIELKKLDVDEKDIIISPVEYIDKKTVSVSVLEYPKELLLKDISYAEQNELRIIINSNSKVFKEHMKKNNNIIDVGNLKDITKMYDYYFNDLLLEKQDNTLLFNLPNPIDIPLDDMELNELIDIYNQVIRDKLPSPMPDNDKRDLIEYIKNLIKEKCDADIGFANGSI